MYQQPMQVEEYTAGDYQLSNGAISHSTRYSSPQLLHYWHLVTTADLHAADNLLEGMLYLLGTHNSCQM